MGMTIIKGYEMPHNCYDCDLHNYHECDLTSESIEEDYCWNGDSREKHCPLREVEAIPKADYDNRLKADLDSMAKAINYGWELRVNEVLDKIRAEIAELSHYYPMGHDYQIAITRCIAVIDKYKAEIEPQESEG